MKRWRRRGNRTRPSLGCSPGRRQPIQPIKLAPSVGLTPEETSVTASRNTTLQILPALRPRDWTALPTGALLLLQWVQGLFPPRRAPGPEHAAVSPAQHRDDAEARVTASSEP